MHFLRKIILQNTCIRQTNILLEVPESFIWMNNDNKNLYLHDQNLYSIAKAYKSYN